MAIGGQGEAVILVTGAGGKTGRAIIAALAARGVAVRGLVRRIEQVAVVKSHGAQDVCVGSFTDPVALRRAAQGVTGVYHICPNVSPDEIAFAKATATAVADAGAGRFVYHSVLHPQIEAMPHHWAKLRVEEWLLASGLDVTLLQPTAYMDNLLAGWDGIVADGVHLVPYPIETRISLVDLADVAAVAAEVMTQGGHEGATYELVGTEPLSQIEIAAVLSQAVGRPVRAVSEPVEVWEARARAGGLGDYQRETLVAMFRNYASIGLAGNTNMLRWLLRRAPRTLAEFAAAAAANG